MTGAIFLLGPDEWDDGFEARAPAWLANEIHDLGGRGYQPKHLRVYLKRILEHRYAIPCVVMDPTE